MYTPWGATSVKQEIDIFRGTRTSAGWCPLLHAYCWKKVWLSEAPCQHTTSSQHVQVCLGLETTSSTARRGVFGPFPADYAGKPTRNGGGTLSHLPPIGGNMEARNSQEHEDAKTATEWEGPWETSVGDRAIFSKSKSQERCHCGKNKISGTLPLW